MSTLQVHTDHHRNGGMLVRLSGEGHVTAADDLNQSFQTIAETGPRLVVVDMAELSFAGSMVMAALVRFRGLVRANGGVMKMAGLQMNVAEAFKKANLDWIIPTFPTVEQALAE